MAEDTGSTTDPVVNDKITIKTRLGSWWNDNKGKLAWFGVGALTGAGTVVAAALLLEPAEDLVEGTDVNNVDPVDESQLTES